MDLDLDLLDFVVKGIGIWTEFEVNRLTSPRRLGRGRDGGDNSGPTSEPVHLKVERTN